MVPGMVWGGEGYTELQLCTPQKAIFGREVVRLRHDKIILLADFFLSFGQKTPFFFFVLNLFGGRVASEIAKSLYDLDFG